MPDLAQDASTAADPVQAYVASLFAALGSRGYLEVLREGPAAVREAVAGLSPAQLTMPERAGKWSVLQVVQHQADAELVVGFRLRMGLTHDRPLLPGYDQDLWAERLRYQESDLETVLGDFGTLRRGNLRLYERAAPADRQRVMRHSERGDESVEQMIRMLAGHDMVHRGQIARIRAAIGAPQSPG
jgi:DinB superfamily